MLNNFEHEIFAKSADLAKNVPRINVIYETIEQDKDRLLMPSMFTHSFGNLRGYQYANIFLRILISGNNMN